MDQQPERLGRNLLIIFVVALVGYAGFFSCDAHLRTHKGPWVVQFVTSNEPPRIIISQPFLQISNVTVSFPGEKTTNAQSASFVFDRPSPNRPLPFGTVKFEDLTYLPGSVAFDFFGHELELLPRTLIINQSERGWTSGKEFKLDPGEKLPPERFYDPRAKKRKW
jgi:hypothetical protein